jgi:hypothetical protein
MCRWVRPANLPHGRADDQRRVAVAVWLGLHRLLRFVSSTSVGPVMLRIAHKLSIASTHVLAQRRGLPDGHSSCSSLRRPQWCVLPSG